MTLTFVLDRRAMQFPNLIITFYYIPGFYLTYYTVLLQKGHFQTVLGKLYPIIIKTTVNFIFMKAESIYKITKAIF